VSDELPKLPPAVEVAAYRIAIEAVTNATRHADASRCTIALRLDRQLELEIDDDGAGLPAAPRAGVGLRSMRERATELSGSFDIDSGPGRGTRIRVSLPVGA
jgi:signal transduction histidine kinase